jgi:hypothetical protein
MEREKELLDTIDGLREALAKVTLERDDALADLARFARNLNDAVVNGYAVVNEDLANKILSGCIVRGVDP